MEGNKLGKQIVTPDSKYWRVDCLLQVEGWGCEDSFGPKCLGSEPEDEVMVVVLRW